MRIFLLLSLLLPLSGCLSTAAHLDRVAQRAGLQRLQVADGSFPALLYLRQSQRTDQPLLVFIDGDGIPWRGGRTPSADPTSQRALALQLLMVSSAPALYVSRPCYHGLHSEHCTAQMWTSGRYSTAVVESMAQTIDAARQRLDLSEVVLVGYSGGGTLAVLIAERLDDIAGVLTLGANLDVQAWSSHHGYLALAESLDPSRSSHAHPWPELHLQGEADQQVPPITTEAYFQRYPQAQREVLTGHDHACCWVEDWPALLERASRHLPIADRADSAVSGKSENSPSTPSS